MSKLTFVLLLSLIACGRSQDQGISSLSLQSGVNLGPQDLIPKSTVSFHRVNYLSGTFTTGEQYCTGTIIRSQWILTAAHCLIAPGDVIKFYSGSSYSGDERHVSADILANPIRFPPFVTPYTYLVNNQRQDFALVKMDNPIPLNDGRYVAAMVSLKLPDSIDPVLGNKGWIAGGSKSTTAGGALQYADAQVTEFSIARNAITVDTYAQSGDSGGPFFTLTSEPRQLELKGVISAVGGSTLGTSVTYVGGDLRNWIISNVQ